MQFESRSRSRPNVASAPPPRHLGSLLWSFLCAFVLAVLATPPADAELMVAAQHGGSVASSVASGDHVYVSRGSSVVTLRRAQKGSGEEVSVSGRVPGFIRALDVHRDRLYVAWKGRISKITVSVFSLEQPERPRVLGPLDAPGLTSLQAKDLAVVGDVLYVLADELVPIDLSDPVRPTIGSPASVSLSVHLEPLGPDHLIAYSSDPGGTLIGRVYDISSPLAPVLAESFFSAGYNPTVTVRGRLVAFFSGGFLLLDFSDPLHPVELHREHSLGIRSGVLLDHHLVMSAEDGLRVWDVSDPSDPFEVASVPTPAQPTRVVTSSDDERLVFVSSKEAVEVDVTDPENPVVKSVTRLPGGAAPRYLTDFGDELLVGQSWGGLQIVGPKLDTLAEPAPVADLYLRGLGVGGELALAADVLVGLHVLDVSNPFEPLLLGTLPVAAGSSVIVGDRAWAVGGEGLLTLDLSQPDSPRVVHEFDLHGTPALRLDGDLLYVAEDSFQPRMRILDVAGAVPVEIGRYTGCRAAEVDVRGSLAAVYCREQEMHLVDIADPARPALLGIYTHPDHFLPQPSSVLFVDNDLVMLGYGGGIDVVDVGDPTRPALDQRLELGGRISQMTVGQEGDVWAAGGHGGLARIQESGVVMTPQSLDEPSARR